MRLRGKWWTAYKARGLDACLWPSNWSFIFPESTTRVSQMQSARQPAFGQAGKRRRKPCSIRALDAIRYVFLPTSTTRARKWTFPPTRRFRGRVWAKFRSQLECIATTRLRACR